VDGYITCIWTDLPTYLLYIAIRLRQTIGPFSQQLLSIVGPIKCLHRSHARRFGAVNNKNFIPSAAAAAATAASPIWIIQATGRPDQSKRAHTLGSAESSLALVRNVMIPSHLIPHQPHPDSGDVNSFPSIPAPFWKIQTHLIMISKRC
jgi:hypothetical protein